MNRTNRWTLNLSLYWIIQFEISNYRWTWRLIKVIFEGSRVVGYFRGFKNCRKNHQLRVAMVRSLKLRFKHRVPQWRSYLDRSLNYLISATNLLVHGITFCAVNSDARSSPKAKFKLNKFSFHSRMQDCHAQYNMLLQH